MEKLIDEAESETADDVVSEAKRNCPIGESRWFGGGRSGGFVASPGSLKDSIRKLKSKYEDGGYIVMAGGDDVYYAPFVELGTQHIKSNPFLRNAGKKQGRAFRGRLKEIMD